MHIDGLELTGNTANGSNISGGALFVSCSVEPRQVGIFNSTISNNTATGTKSARGGGLYVASCGADPVSTTISGNTLVNTGSADSQGGGVYSSYSTRNVRLYAGSSISGNTADSGGGAWCSTGKWQIGGTLAGNNQADTDFMPLTFRLHAELPAYPEHRLRIQASGYIASTYRWG